MRTLAILCCSAFAIAGNPQFLSAAPNDLFVHVVMATNAEAGWQELREASQIPQAPAVWDVTPPTFEERSKYFMPFLQGLQDKSRDFYSKFPNDAHAVDARLEEFQITMTAFQMGDTNQRVRLDASEKSLLDNPAISENERFKIYNSKMLALLRVARNSEPSQARPLLEEIAASTAVDQLKDQAADELKKLEAVGKPLELQFTAVDGREVELSKLKGKVVLLDFWATWCPACIGELPHVTETYGKLHSQGFEVVGISLDENRDTLTRFVAERKMAWPQYFDGLHWQNKFAREFGIESIPAMWLLDKKGIVRDVNAEADLNGKVARLLAE
jgi:thiol-disulfide isomerase/thioredoxin